MAVDNANSSQLANETTVSKAGTTSTQSSNQDQASIEEKPLAETNISFFALSNELSELADSREKKGKWRKNAVSEGSTPDGKVEPTVESKNIIGKRRASMRSLGTWLYCFFILPSINCFLTFLVFFFPLLLVLLST